MKKIENAFLPACAHCPDRRGILYSRYFQDWNIGYREISPHQRRELDKWYKSNDGEYMIATIDAEGGKIPLCSTCIDWLHSESSTYTEMISDWNKVVPARKTYHGPRKNRK